MPKDKKNPIEAPVIDECELEGFVNVGLPMSPHVNFNLSRNKKHDSNREKKPIDMFFTRWELGEIITKCDRENEEDKKEKAKDAKGVLRKYLTTVEEREVDEQTPLRSSYKVTKENAGLMGSASQKEKRRRHNQPFPGLAHTFFGAPFGITQRTQMEAYRLWVDSDSSDEELDVEKDEGEKCCGLCVVQ